MIRGYENNRNRLLKVTAIMTLIIFVTIHNSPVDEYDISVLDSASFSIWLGIFLIICHILIVNIIYDSKYLAPYILLPIILLISFPFIKYHMFLTPDAYTHVGIIQDIIDTNTITDGNIYPGFHLTAASLAILTDLDPYYVTYPILVVFSTFYLLIAIIFTSIISPNRVGTISIQIVPIMYLSWEFTHFAPWAQTNMLIIIVLYLTYRISESSGYKRYSIILLMLGLSIVFYHPLTSLIIIGILFAFYIFDYYNNNFYNKSQGILYVCIVLLTFILWLGRSTTLQQAIGTRIISTLGVIGLKYSRSGAGSSGAGSSGAGSSGAGSFTSEYSIFIDILNSTDPFILDVLFLILVRYPQTILISLSFIMYSYLWLSDDGIDRMIHFLLLGGWGAWLLSVILLFAPIGFGFERILQISSILSIPILAIGIGSLIKERSEKTYIALVILIAITSLLFISFYNTEYKKIPNDQLTESEVSSTRWFLQYNNQTKVVYSWQIDVKRHSDLNGLENRQYDQNPPDHFGYSQSDRGSLENDSYLLTSNRERYIYPRFYPNYKDHWRFKPSDFYNLKNDKSMTQLYDSGNINIYS